MMLSEEIMSIYARLESVLLDLEPENADIVRRCRANLLSAAEQAQSFEESFVFPELS